MTRYTLSPAGRDLTLNVVAMSGALSDLRQLFSLCQPFLQRASVVAAGRLPARCVDLHPPLEQPRGLPGGRTPGRRPSPSTRTRSRSCSPGILVLVPLALHTVWGISRLWSSQPNNVQATATSATWKYAAPAAERGGRPLLPRRPPLAGDVAPPPRRGARGGVRGHLPRDALPRADAARVHPGHPRRERTTWPTACSSVCMGWGVVSSRRALRHLEWVTILTFLLLLAMSWGAIYGLYSATRLDELE